MQVRGSEVDIRIIISLEDTGSVEEARLLASSITPCGDTAIHLSPVFLVGEG
jgi:hypothetical protein